MFGYVDENFSTNNKKVFLIKQNISYTRVPYIEVILYISPHNTSLSLGTRHWTIWLN